MGEMRVEVEPDARPGGLSPVDEERLPRERPRPRRSRRQRTALVAALLFFLSPVLAAGLGARPAEFENRRLAPFPSLTQGWQFLPGLSNWAGDHLPGRDVAVQTVDGISGSLFAESYPFGQGTVEPGPPTGPVPSPLNDAELARQRDQLLRMGFPQVLQGRDGWFYLGYDVLGACLPERSLDEVFSSVLRLRAVVEGSGRQFVLIPAPNKSTMVPEHLPQDYVGAQCARQATDEFWTWMSEQPGVIDLRPELGQAAARSATPVYSPVDTHWTEEGGLLMTRALAEMVAPDSTRTWSASTEMTLRRSGDLPLLIGRTIEYDYASYRLAPDGRTETQRRVDSEFRQPLRLQRPPLTGTVPDRVGMIADSYTLFATAYLAAGFEDLTLLHVDTVATDHAAVARLLAEDQVIVFEVAERSLIGGISPILTPQFIDVLAEELARNPIR